MIRTINIELVVDSETHKVVGADMRSGFPGYDRLELVGAGEEESISNTLKAISEHIMDYLD